MYLGLNKDVYQARVFAIYQDPIDNCNVVVTTFPGQQIDFHSYDENGCLNLTAWFGRYWEKTIKDERGQVELESSKNFDPFNIFNQDPAGVI